MTPGFRRLSAACLFILLPALWLAPVNAACVHYAAADAAHTAVTPHAPAHDELDAAEDSADAPACPLHLDQAGCMVQAPLPVEAAVQQYIAAATLQAIPIVTAYVTAEPSLIFRPPRV